MRRIWALLAAGVLAVGVLAVSSESASAGFSGATGATGCNGVNMTYNASVTFYYNDGMPTMRSAIDWTRANNLDPTDINTQEVFSTNTDVVLRENAYTDYCGVNWYTPLTGGATGLTECYALESNNRCDLHTIRFTTTYTSFASTTAKRYLACHETGHVLGLTHATGGDTCMIYNSSTMSTHYSSTEIGWINGAF